MTRAAEVAAALERWTAVTNPVDGPGDISQKDTLQAGDALAALLRESQPEPATVIEESPTLTEPDWREAAQPEPAAVGGDDGALLANAVRIRSEADEVIAEWHALTSQTIPHWTGIMRHGDKLVAALRLAEDAYLNEREAHEIEMKAHSAALADVARLTEELDSARSRIGPLDAQVEMARANTARMTDERDSAWAETRKFCALFDKANAALAAAEKMLRFAAGRISTEPEWASKHPEEVLAWLREECERDSARAGRNDG